MWVINKKVVKEKFRAALTFFLGKRRCSTAEAESTFAVGKYVCGGRPTPRGVGSAVAF